MSNWGKVTLNECCEIIGDGLHGTPDFCESGDYFFINGNNLNNGRILINNNTKKCDINEFYKYKKNINKSTIFLSINGTLGNLAKYNNEKIILGKSACYLNIKKEIDFNFVFYVLLNEDFQHYIKEFATGTTIKNVRLQTIRTYQFNLPPLEEQKAIAGVLSSFDDKIELNNKIIKNLEEQAQTLYKHWFVDFEFPNENGQPYKSSGGTFKDSELGKIPTDWEVSLLKKFLLFQKGFEPGNKTYLENQNLDNIPFYRVGELLSNPKIFINKNLNPNVCIANIKDVLVSFDGTVGRVSIAKRGAFSSGIRKIVSKVNSINNAFIYVLFKSDYIQNEMKKYESNRTTITHASGAINDFLIAYSSNIYLKFSIIIDPLYNELIQLKLENEKLAEMRDYLLPKLMSGKIRVKVD